jgi:hypothetical protein
VSLRKTRIPETIEYQAKDALRITKRLGDAILDSFLKGKDEYALRFLPLISEPALPSSKHKRSVNTSVPAPSLMSFKDNFFEYSYNSGDACFELVLGVAQVEDQ